MAKFTMELRTIVESGTDLFNFEYPIFDESYRGTLEKKILDHYYFREIGVETVGRFLFNLRTRMNEIMPYFNKRYEGMLIEQRILDNYDVTETITTTNKDLFSDTPQGRIELTNSSDYVTSVQDNTETVTRNIQGNYGVQTDAVAVSQYMSSLVNVDMEVIEALSDLFMKIYL